MERNHFGKFGRGPLEEHLCEAILDLGQWFRRRFKAKVFFHTERLLLVKDTLLYLAIVWVLGYK